MTPGSEQLIIAAMTFAVRFGLQAAIILLKSKAATLDEAATALEAASKVTAEEIRDKAP